MVVAEAASVYQGEGASLYTSFLDVGSGAGAHYLPTLKSGEQIAREKDTVAGEGCGPSTEIAAKRERTTDGTERSADKEVKRRKCPPTSGNGKRKEKRTRRPRERKWRRRREQDLEQGYISKKEKEKRERTSEKKRERDRERRGREEGPGTLIEGD